MRPHPFLIIIIIYLTGCSVIEGKPGVSDTIGESKKRGVFICEYQSDTKVILKNDTAKLTFKNAWLERRWIYDTHFKGSIAVKGYQLIIHTDDIVDEDYAFTWTIGTDFKRNFRKCGYTCIVTEFDSLPKTKESWEIQEGRDLYEGAKHKIIGMLTLYKK